MSTAAATGGHRRGADLRRIAPARRRALTHEARHLAAETHDESPLPEALAQMAVLAATRGRDLAFTQLALSLAKEERGTPDMMFAAGRDLLDAMDLRNGPTIAVLHGPPDDAHLHLHVVVPLVDGVTGKVRQPARLPRDAWEAARAVAPRYGWEPPRLDDRQRRRAPRAARSLGVWHGDRSLHAWLGEVAGPRLLPYIDAAASWAEVSAALAEFGLRYARTERGAVIEDHSSEPPRRVAASALAFRASATALEKRLGPTPTLPVPADARSNSRAYANDREGRTLPVGTPEDRREFAAAHATWRAVWLPVRDRQLAAQRALEAGRREALRDLILRQRSVRDEVAQNRREWLEANRFIRDYYAIANKELVERAKAERAALRALPFGQPPPARLLEWLRTRTGTATEVPTLRGPIGATTPPAAAEAEVAPYRCVRGLDGDTEWWSERRRVAVDRGAEIVVCDPAALGVALAVGNRRWTGIWVAGDQPFRDAARAAAETANISVDFADRAEPAEIVTFLEMPEYAGISRAAAIAQHLDLHELLLDGQRFRPDHAEQPARPRAGTRSTVAFDSDEVIVVAASESRMRTMERAGFTPALETEGTAVFVFDRQTTPKERAYLTEALIDTYTLERREVVFIDGPIRFRAAGMCEGFRQMLTRMRPQPQPVSFTERVEQIQRFIDSLVGPRPDEPAIVAQPPKPALAPTRGRKRESRRR